MDVKKSLEDQFSNLHPCHPLNTRIGIIGGGPSGISAAYALTKLGYQNVTILEKYHTVSGMCESILIEGKNYDLGGQVLAANSAPTIFHLAKETESELVEMNSHKLALIDSSTGKYQDIPVVDDYASVIPLTIDLQDKAKQTGRIGIHAVAEYASDVAPAFLEGHGLKSVPKSVAYGYTASGYGFVEDMPYAYLHEFTRTSMAGKIRRFRDGYMSLWQKISQALPMEVHCNTEVVAVRRDSSSVRVDVKSIVGERRTLEFDKIIISGAFPFRSGKTYGSDSPFPENEAMDLTEVESGLFSKVQTIDYYTTVLKIEGFEHLPIGFYYFEEFMNREKIGNPVAMQRFYADTNIFLFWSYGNSVDITGSKVRELAENAVNRMGGVVQRLILQRRFKYFPHVSSQDMKEGFFEKVESRLQGQLNTYYVGGLLAFELTERNSSYAMSLVRNHFATNSALPIFPYVKRLLHLQQECRKRTPRDLGECNKVEFPDLSSLDGYLKHWGMHEVTKNKILYNWLNDEGEVICQRTYSELNANASCVSHNLLTCCRPVIKPGDRVLLVHVPGLDFIDAFFGCLRARVLPVPVLPPDPLQRGGQALLKIENIAKSCNAVAILSTAGYHTAVRAGAFKNLVSIVGKNGKNSARWPDLPWLHTDSWVKNTKNKSREEEVKKSFGPEPQSNDLCFLQFTSGSTGDAKGVVITHGGLIHNVKLMRTRYRSTSNTVLLSWLPQYHDMGLIGGLFTAMVSGGTAVLFSPLSFIKNPLLWLQTMSKYKATHSAGPNFAFELVVRRLEIQKDKLANCDLSSMIFLMVAAEPVRPKTIGRFLELTVPLGLSEYAMAPGYGLAENCVFVSCAFGEGQPIFVDWQGRVCCGYVDSNCSDIDIDIKIVNPESGSEEEDGKEGEIWISSPSSGIGYWSREDLSERTFRNKLPNVMDKIYTRTGDLGRIIDGKLFITGRIKDLIIVAGRNIYSADVEKTVESSSELLRPGCCAVVGVPEEILSTKGISVPDHSDQVGLVVIAEVRDGKPPPKDLIEQIQTRVAEEHGVNIALVKLIKPRTISKTTSGKIKRYDCLKQFVDGTLNLVPEPLLPRRSLVRSFTTGTCKEGMTPRARLVKNDVGQRLNNKDIIGFLKGLISEISGISINKISTSENMATYGIDSIGVVRAAQKLSDFLGVPIGAVDIFTATCIEELAKLSEDLLAKSHEPHNTLVGESFGQEIETDFDSSSLVSEVSISRQLGISLLQLLALFYVSTMLILPAHFSISAFITTTSFMDTTSWVVYLLSLALAPLAWILAIFCTGVCIKVLGNSFLQTNYALTPEIPIWSVDFVKWWALYKTHEISSRVMAVHLRGTVFLKYWFEILGARIGSSVLLDTVDITDPSLVSIGDGAVIAEGVLVQSHEVRNGVLSFQPIRIGRNCSIGPYAVILKGSVLGEETEVPALQKTEASKPVRKPINKIRKSSEMEKNAILDHFMALYMVGFLSSTSAAIVYSLYVWLFQKAPSQQHFAFICVSGTFHWLPYVLVVYASMMGEVYSDPKNFAFSLAIGYLAHGFILSLLTSIATRFVIRNKLIRRKLIIACHIRFAKLLSGTEAFCIYLRLLGAKIGKYCSIRAINPVSNPKLMKLGNGVHLGDFCRIITGFHSSNGFVQGKTEVGDNSVIGSQSLILPGSVVQQNVILGALSIAPANSVLRSGGVYIGSQAPIMIKNTIHPLDERIEEMDFKYKKIIGNLAANLAATTLKVGTRYFHRIGVSGKGTLKIYNRIEGFPNHSIFHPGKSYPVIVRHSNSLSADDDARIDARGASIKILSDKINIPDSSSPLLDFTLKTGNAFYARTISDFATWLVCGIPAREEQVKRTPHIGQAVWNSLRNANSFTELHYYSNICRLLRFVDGQEMYVKFKLRPFDENFNENVGKVNPTGILPPETGAIPRDENDVRPLLFLADDFRRRVNSSDGVRYVFQLQFRPVPDDEMVRDIALDCTKPWDETEFPFVDVGEIVIDRNLTSEESDKLEFNPFLRFPEVDVIKASSSTQSASIDHGRSLIYEICQHLRNEEPLPEAWRILLEQSDVKVDLSGCPMAATFKKTDSKKLNLKRTWLQSIWVTFVQPILQIAFPYYLMGLTVFTPLTTVFYLNKTMNYPLQLLLPPFWVVSGILSALICAGAKWVFVGKNEESKPAKIWSARVFMDTIWQALRTLVGEYFMETTSGSSLFVIWMKLMGSGVELGAYVDSMGATLNPEMVEIDRDGCVGKESLLFGHIYEGDEDGEVRFGRISIGEGGFVGSRAVVMPGVRVETGGKLSALSLAMKQETISASK
ncbi:uncharacterized protein LOC124927969 [Impatiens glandulifera]|uniref:uncharacterized protein LOC124927969 n=1 Tax=Impatiens glandulifera TaxID=253017 RepID=UPI001FB13319|nr:uncharacterized protein LOC124927969 [Impatiens glandulifera]XP_047324437.1 uncharacterized protein LOC124927969 [Impatiens glandulifera]XP_047324438.1 uncharacterized protein LOC124927969 [Impatiens glandulifera]XP_047324439.1 uncharacterized protein LOC124927969 [Impatiens glandulifera]